MRPNELDKVERRDSPKWGNENEDKSVGGSDKESLALMSPQ